MAARPFGALPPGRGSARFRNEFAAQGLELFVELLKLFGRGACGFPHFQRHAARLLEDRHALIGQRHAHDALVAHDGKAETDDGSFSVKLGTPRELGGDGDGKNPEQLFASGLAACFLSAMKLVCLAEQGPPGHSCRRQRQCHGRQRTAQRQGFWPDRRA
ncbi:hypothetical protein [Novosphingobium sp. PY1]|uniref:hypothetical protein n=1 Tax=Novosphingobium sp. PY1 TaxID=1882221 RepID=UPI001F5D8D4F